MACLSAATPVPDEPADIFVYDPEVPVLAPGGPAAPSGQFDQAALELGNNVLVYTTEPLPSAAADFRRAARLALLRHVRRLHADFTAKLVRVRPQRRGGIHLHRHRAIELAFRESRIRRGSRFTTGNSISSRLRASSPLASAFGWKSRAALFRYTTAIPGAGSLVAAPLPGTGCARRRSFITRRELPSALHLPVGEGGG